MSEMKLLPCPFCDGRPEVIEITEDDGFENRGGSAIECQGCHASSHVEFGRKENLISSWNRRTALSSAVVAEREPAYWAVHSKTGMHIGLWPHKSDADEALRGYEGGTITALYLDPPPTSEIEAENARLKARVAEALKALEPFARLIDEMKFDIDNNGNPLPDDQSVGWVYVTIGDFRAARRVREGGKVE